MVIEVQREAKSFAKYLIESAKHSWEVCLPFRQSLLMSWCNPSEKDYEKTEHNKQVNKGCSSAAPITTGVMYNEGN